MNINSIDSENIWHPYSSFNSNKFAFKVKKTKNVFIYLENDEKLIDAISSWWCMIHGYNNKFLNNAVTMQLYFMSHVMFGGLTHRPAITLTTLLLDLIPDKSLNKIFYCDSGSVSVEIAMKMAIQYFLSKDQNTKKVKFLTFEGGYHGDTLNAMSLNDPINGMHNFFHKILPKQIFLPKPKIKFNENWDKKEFEKYREIIENRHHEICAFIVEPIVQGAGGMNFYHPQYLNEIKTLCDKYNILIIFDEIATGFGRTGKLFAFEYVNFFPDILCIGKSLTAGYVSFAATICKDFIAKSISENPPYVFMHGPTYMANPLACALAISNIKLLAINNSISKVNRISETFLKETENLKNLDIVLDVRGIGGIGVIELKKNVDLFKVTELFVNDGVWLRPFKNLIYIMPPYIISDILLMEILNSLNKNIKIINDNPQKYLIN